MTSRQTSSTASGRSVRRAAWALALVGTAASAQITIRPEDRWVGSDAWRYGIAAEGLVRARVTDRRLPWVLDSAPRRLSVRGITLRVDWSSDLPFSRGDASAWSGVGPSVRVQPLLAMQAGPVQLRLAPLAWWSGNEAFPLVPAGPTPYSHAALGCCMDLPQRFGAHPLGRLDPGESELVVRALGLRLAMTSATPMVGAGREHTFLVGPEAGGFPRFEIGAPRVAPFPLLGTFSINGAWGRVAQTPWAPNRRAGARLGTYLEGWWSSPGTGRLQLGGGRFYHFDWSGWNAQMLPKLFGSVFKDRQVYEGGESDNQLLAIWGRLRIPEAGLEFSGELGKNDRSVDLRDFGNELEHNGGWTVAARKVWLSRDQVLWALDLSAASQRIPELEMYRGQAFNYEHSPITQGHTARGQLLGTLLLEGAGGAAVRVDRYTATGRVSVSAMSRALANARVQAVPTELTRQEWSVAAEWTRRLAFGEVLVGAAGVADIGRIPPGRDARSVQLSTGFRWPSR